MSDAKLELDDSLSPTPEAAYASEEPTHASNEWLEDRGHSLKRWIGHGIRFMGSEMAINWGTGMATFGALASVLTANPVPLMLLGGSGAALAGGGIAAEWSGMKHAESDAEKKVFWLSKLGQTIGTGAVVGLSLLSSPLYLPIATGLYYAGVGMGARAVTHRR